MSDAFVVVRGQTSGAEQLITVSVKINPVKYQTDAETTPFCFCARQHKTSFDSTQDADERKANKAKRSDGA